MEKKIEYSSFEDRQKKSRQVIANNKKNGTAFCMTSDNFDDPNWKHGDPQVGVMTFTDEPEPVVEQKPNLEDRVAALEKKVA